MYSQFVKDVKFQDGRYCVRLPWRETHPLLTDNFDLSKKRLFSLLKRLRQYPNILNQYDATIRDQMKKGVVEVVTATSDSHVGITHTTQSSEMKNRPPSCG